MKFRSIVSATFVLAHLAFPSSSEAVSWLNSLILDYNAALIITGKTAYPFGNRKIDLRKSTKCVLLELKIPNHDPISTVAISKEISLNLGQIIREAHFLQNISMRFNVIPPLRSSTDLTNMGDFLSETDGMIIFQRTNQQIQVSLITMDPSDQWTESSRMIETLFTKLTRLIAAKFRVYRTHAHTLDTITEESEATDPNVRLLLHLAHQ